VVGASTLVAGGRTRATGEAASEAAEAAAGGSGATAHSRARAVASEMASHATAVAAAAGAGAAQAQSGAVSLDVSEALAVVALLGFEEVSDVWGGRTRRVQGPERRTLGGAGMGAPVGLVARLLAVVAKPLGRRAHLCHSVSVVLVCVWRGAHRHSDRHCRT
jgi:hypothetical protein